MTMMIKITTMTTTTTTTTMMMIIIIMIVIIPTLDESQSPEILQTAGGQDGLQMWRGIPGKSKECFTSPKHPDRLWGTPTSYSTGTGVLSRKSSSRGVKLTPHLHLGPRFRISGAIYLSPQCLNVVYRENFTFTVRPNYSTSSFIRLFVLSAHSL